jgi:hypothetical protein
MARVIIPPAVREGLDVIALLNEEQFQELFSAVSEIPSRIRQHRIFDLRELKLASIPPRESDHAQEALFSLYISRVGTEVLVPDFVDDIAESLKEEKRSDKDWTDSEETLGRFKERLTKLLSIGTLNKIAKAHDVLLEHAQTFAKARILSDIRPVFGEKIDSDLAGAMIVHMLKIDYSRSGRREEFFVALDTKDIQLLIDTLERAKLKTEQLKSVIDSASLEYFEVV